MSLHVLCIVFGCAHSTHNLVAGDIFVIPGELDDPWSSPHVHPVADAEIRRYQCAVVYHAADMERIALAERDDSGAFIVSVLRRRGDSIAHESTRRLSSLHVQLNADECAGGQ
jgi:hypothetical protein